MITASAHSVAAIASTVAIATLCCSRKDIANHPGEHESGLYP